MRRIAAAKQDRTLVDIELVSEKYSDKNSQRANNVTALINKEKSQGGEYRMPKYNNGINTKAEYNRRGSIVGLWKANDG
jgi:hypothetical protein